MAVKSNQTIVWSRDAKAYARFLAGLLGLPEPKRVHHFEVVTTANGLKRRRADKESNIGTPLRTAGSTTGPIPRDAGRARSTATTPVAASVSRTRAAISWRSSLRL